MTIILKEEKQLTDLIYSQDIFGFAVFILTSKIANKWTLKKRKSAKHFLFYVHN